MSKIDFNIEGKTYKLGNSDKEITLFPADASFPDRLEQAYSEIEKYISNLKNAEDTNVMLKQISETDKYIRSKIDYAFGYEISQTVFGCVSAASLDENGFYLFEKFISAMLPVIEKEFNNRLDKLNKRVKSYTDKKGIYSSKRK